MYLQVIFLLQMMVILKFEKLYHLQIIERMNFF